MEQKIQNGQKVQWIDNRKVKVGTVDHWGRSSKHPWKVYYVASEDGLVVEIHADRLEVRA